MSDVEEITVDAYKNEVDKPFKVSVLGLLDQQMTLTRAQELPLENTVRKNAPFLLEFSAPSGCLLKDGLYTVSGEDGEAREIFLTVEGDDQVTKKYEALFR